MNMRYALRSEDTEQINVIQWAGWNMNRYPELKWLHHCPNGGSRLQDTQKEFLADMAEAGHFVVTCYSAEEAVRILEEYLSLADKKHPERNQRMTIPNNSIMKNGKIKGGDAK